MYSSKKHITLDNAIAWAEDICSRAEYSSGEIRQKLIKKGLSAAESEKVVQRLILLRFIDDKRFAEAFVRDKIRFSKWTKRKTAVTLYSKGVDRNVAAEALESVDDDEYLEILAGVLKAKLRSMKHDFNETMDYETKCQLYRFAASRGFTSSEFNAALNQF